MEEIANRGKLPILLSHHSQFTGASNTLMQLQGDRFNQQVISIDYSREQLGNIKVLDEIQTKLGFYRISGVNR